MGFFDFLKRRKPSPPAPDLEKYLYGLLQDFYEKESVVNSAVNPSTFFAALHSMFDEILEFRKYENYGVFSAEEIESYESLQNNLQEIVDNFLDRAVDNINFEVSSMDEALPEYAVEEYRQKSVANLYHSFNVADSFWPEHKPLPHYQGPLYTNGNLQRVKAIYGSSLSSREQHTFINMSASLGMGDELGFDAVEISAIKFCSPEHEKIQGRVFLRTEFDKMQAGLDFSDIYGNRYRGISCPIGAAGCMHFPTAFSTEYSIRRYSDETLAEWAAENKRGCIVGGKHYTTYEASRYMKEIAGKVRDLKKSAVLAMQEDDEDARLEYQKLIDDEAKQYYIVAEAAGLRPDGAEMSVSGFRRIKIPTAEELQDKADFSWLQSNLPALCPKSLTGYRRMKNQNSKNYQKIVAAARETGREIG